MDVADIVSEQSVFICREKTTKSEILQRLAEHAAKTTGESADTIYSAIHHREMLGPTGLGNGIAVPHGKFVGLKGVYGTFVRLIEPVDFDAVDDQPVDLIMMLMAPVGAGADHLKALARVARLLRTESLVEDLRRTDDPAKIYQLLTSPVATNAAA
jgi:nitrogen PTS system EIIA component